MMYTRAAIASERPRWVGVFRDYADVYISDCGVALHCKPGANVFLGVYSWNNMQNLQLDNDNAAVDLVIQMGDHCYNMGGEDDRRGDG